MKRRTEQRSLFGEILDWMLAPLLLLWPMSVAVTWVVAQGIANRPYDRELGDVARALSRQVTVLAPAVPGRLPRVDVALPEAAVALLRTDEEEQVFYQVLGVRGELLAGDTDLPVPPAETVPASDVRFRDDEVKGLPVRVAYRWVVAPPGIEPHHASLVQVAATLDKRSRLATEIVKGVILPQFVILPIAVVLVWLALSRGIRPLSDLQQRIRRRESTDLSPIAERDVPDEVAPLVAAINDLLQRLDRSMTTQRQFLADAAHQLKTPLAGLRMQAELAERQIDRGEGDALTLKHALQQIALSSQRSAHMVNQLLAMARAENRDAAAVRADDVDLAELTVDTVRDFVPLALDKRIDLGYEGPERGAMLRGQPVLLREAVRNLVDNALRYTPAGGTVTARVTTDPFGQVLVLQVEDNGPGIPPAERESVFRPFYRALGTEVDGSGLGLSIVREIASQHGAALTVDDAQPAARARGEPSPGALFTLRFPLQPQTETQGPDAEA